MFTANAVARIWAPTELITAAFNGEVLSNKKNAATAMAGSITGPRMNNAAIMKGTPRAMLTAETK
jgi:hypothetical protein